MPDNVLISVLVAEPTLLRRPLIVASELHALGFDRNSIEEITKP
jgi:arsenate reductase-like glutaredoxin family protein